MRRRDREVQDVDEAFGILSRCDTVRIGISGEKHPYVVPVSFGAEMAGGKPVVYFHCARQGLKLDLLRANALVCVEGDVFLGVETTEHGITARYESVIGFGACEFVEDEDEAVHGLRLLTGHYGYGDYPLDRCGSMERLLIGKVVLDAITGKRNLPGFPTTADLESGERPRA